MRHFERELLIWHSTLDAESKLILLALNQYMGSNQTAWPSEATIAKDTSLSVRTIQRRIAKLTKDGIVRVKPRTKDGMKTTSEYAIAWNAIGIISVTPSPRTEQEQIRQGVASSRQSDVSTRQAVAHDTTGSRIDTSGSRSRHDWESYRTDPLELIHGTDPLELMCAIEDEEPFFIDEVEEDAQCGGQLTIVPVTQKIVRQKCSGFSKAQFDEFWQHVGFKTGKTDAEKVFLKIKGIEFETIVSALVLQQEWHLKKNGSLQFMKRPPAWLRARGWEDELEPVSARGINSKDVVMAAEVARYSQHLKEVAANTPGRQFDEYGYPIFEHCRFEDSFK